MNKTELVKCVADKSNTSRKEVKEVLDAFISVIEAGLKEMEPITITGLGKFYVKQYKARTITMPDGSRVEIKDKPSPRFKLSGALKHKVVNALL